MPCVPAWALSQWIALFKNFFMKTKIKEDTILKDLRRKNRRYPLCRKQQFSKDEEEIPNFIRTAKFIVWTGIENPPYLVI
jgi:hypothetical protein